jgi:serine/threonine-protein kinase
MDAWSKLDTHYQGKTGLRAYLNFWATIHSVTVISVSPRDATSVIAQCKYVKKDGQSFTDNRWLSMVLVNGQMLVDDSELIG